MIVITSPTGQIGSQVPENPLDADESLPVIARDPASLRAHALDRLEVVQGSQSDATVVEEAFACAGAALWPRPPDPRACSVETAFVGFTRPAAAAFKKQGARRVVGVSALGRGTPWAARAGYVTGSVAMDDLIATTGVANRARSNPSFMDDILRQADAINNQGVFFFSPISGDRKVAAVATRGTAAAATRLRLDPSPPIRYHRTLNGSAERDRREAHATARERGRTF
jgi:uncharacterized protein YbjT (DUF2867 family)